jgi:UDP-N-acetylmuramate dehydrogenase
MQLPPLKGRLEKNYPLKNLSTWKIGGPGEYVFWPASQEEVIKIFRWCKEREWPLTFLGRGSNVLLPDQGLCGVVVVSTELKDLRWEGNRVQVEAGYPLRRLVREAKNKSLEGLEFACGIPGTVGAAIAINAGAYGREIGSLVKEIKVLTPTGEVRKLAAQDLIFRYRGSSVLDNEYFVLEGILELSRGADQAAIQQRIEEFMRKRKDIQPLEYPNAGSVFRNPPGYSAGYLIEAAGWKGRNIGDAEVSAKHANFIINKGRAKAEDVLQLIRLIQEDIESKFGIKLQTEIRVITH